MSSGSCEVSNAASNLTASTFFAPRYFRHSSHLRPARTSMPIGVDKSRASQDIIYRNKKVIPPLLPPSKMDPSACSYELNDKANLCGSKPSNCNGDKIRNEVNSETVRSLASNMESSLTLISPNALSKSNQSSSNNMNNYRNCYNCNDTADFVGKSNPSEHSHANSDSSKSNNVPKYGTPVPNRVFVGGIPLDAAELDVRHLFAQYGNISSVKIITDRAGISKGYGFVTYESDEDAQKVIKEAENLFVKNRKLNVSPAVMKHQQNSFEHNRMIQNSFVYPQLPFSSAANYSQLFPENYHGICPVEGLPLYQIAGMNGHFVSNCPSYLSSPTAQYLSQAAAANAAFSSPYQSAAGYIFPGVSPGTTSSLQMPSQLFHAQSQHANQHLLPGTSIPNAHAFQYSQGTNSNAQSIHALRYQLPPNHLHSSASQSSQQVNLNGSSSHQYVQYPSNTSAINHPSMHLANAMQIHPHHQSHLASLNQLNQVSEITNSTSATTPSTNLSVTGNHLNAALLHHAHQASMYANYSNMAAAHQLSANSSQIACVPNLHLKTDPSNIELLDNVSASIMNGHGTGMNSTGGGIGSLPVAMQISNNGYMPPMMEVVWSSPHVPNTGTYCSGTSIPVSNTSNGSHYPNGNKSHQSNNNNRNSSNPSTSTNNSNSSNTLTKSSHNGNLANGHSFNASVPNGNSGAATSNSSTTTTNTGSSQNSNFNNSSKEKSVNSRHSNYGPSHKKMYNGNGNSHSYAANSKSKMMNGNSRLSDDSIRSDPVEQSSSDQASSYSAQTPKKHSNNSHHSSNSSGRSNSSSSSSANGTTTSGSPQNFVTKTVNGVQIYALAGNGEAITVTSPIEISSASSNNTPPPPHTPSGANQVPVVLQSLTAQ